jgi:hypothetical protein
MFEYQSDDPELRGAVKHYNHVLKVLEAKLNGDLSIKLKVIVLSKGALSALISLYEKKNDWERRLQQQFLEHFRNLRAQVFVLRERHDQIDEVSQVKLNIIQRSCDASINEIDRLINVPEPRPRPEADWSWRPKADWSWRPRPNPLPPADFTCKKCVHACCPTFVYKICYRD